MFGDRYWQDRMPHQIMTASISVRMHQPKYDSWSRFPLHSPHVKKENLFHWLIRWWVLWVRRHWEPSPIISWIISQHFKDILNGLKARCFHHPITYTAILRIGFFGCQSHPLSMIRSMFHPFLRMDDLSLSYCTYRFIHSMYIDYRYRYVFDLEPSGGGLTFKDRGHLGSRCTLPATSSLPLKIGHPKRKGSSFNHPFAGATVDGSG